MLSKSFAAFILLVLTSSVNAQVAFEPVLGGPATPVAADVQHPASGTPCGDASVPKYIDSSSCIQADTNGGFTVPFSNFGSAAPTISKLQVNADGTGVGFVSGQVPTVDGSQLNAQLPSGTKCAGGPNKDRCVVSIVAADGTGNCVLVQQQSTGTNDSNQPPASTSTIPSPSPSPNPQGSAKSNDGSADNGNKVNTNNGTTSNKVNQRSRNFKRVHAHGKRL